ncbi:MAG: hypothetical protein Q4F56_03255, partial [Candidatus Saccharibacteria bacterium]|nr:hypothetical protein [Candidatus Saccharibacteria bacterium]
MDDSVFATAPTLTVTIPENIVSISVAPASADGTFVESDDLDFSVTTDNYSGYNLTIKAASATNLVSGTDVLATLPSGSSLTAEAFEGGANYINKWGYKPSKLNSVANSTYRPSPSTTTGDVIENRNTAGTNIQYTISIGAKVDLTQPIGEYSNTFVITAVANL